VPHSAELSSVITAIGAGVGGLYLSTHSVVVTGIGAALTAVIAVPVALVKRAP
jgi:hypothetical protein